jgi:hypothetical protein
MGKDTMRKATPENNLALIFPRIASQLHSRNGLKPEGLTPSSNKKVWWCCDVGHEWFVSVNARTKHGSGCPYCSGRLATPEDNLSVCNPLLISEWNVEKNAPIHPRSIKSGSHKKVWWKCVRGHEWSMSPNARTIQGQGCPYCSGRRVGQGNSLKDINPDIARFWHPTKNGKKTACDVTAGSHDDIWWKCEKGHEWQAKVCSRTGSGCPYCSGRVVCKDNNLVITHPAVTSEWHPDKNGKLKPENVVAGSHKSVWWRCERGHEWQTKIFARAKLGSSCPKCSSRLQVSKFELRVYAELFCVFGTAKHGERINGKEVDVFLPNFKIAIEIDGSHWHAQKDAKDNEKAESLKQAGITLIRMRESPLSKLSDLDVVYANADSGSDSFSSVALLVETIGRLRGINCSWYRQGGKFVNDDLYLASVQCLAIKQGKSLMDKFPNIAKTWHPTRNGKLTPEKVSYGSKFNAWWKCDNNHEWQRKVNYCTTEKTNRCPFCSGRRKKENVAHIAEALDSSKTDYPKYQLEVLEKIRSERPRYNVK